jgi:integrase
MAVTAKEVEAAVKRGQTKDDKRTLWVGNGLHMVLDSAAWRYKYRVAGRERLMSFGQFPDVSLAAAVKAHCEARAVVLAGGDPLADRKAQKVAQRQAEASSFASVAALWLEWFRTKTTSDRHFDTTESRLNNHVLRVLGSKGVKELRRAEVVAFAKQIEKDHGREMAERCLMVVRQILNYAADHEYVEANVAAGIKPNGIFLGSGGVRKNHARVTVAELPGLLQSIELYQGTAMTRLAMKLMGLTLLRTGELIGLRWSEVDLTASEIKLPAERMKGKKPHVAPLSRQAVEVLSLLKKLTGEHSSGLLFPGDRRNAAMSNMTVLGALKRMGFAGRMTGHGFRGVGSTLLHESRRFEHDVIEAALAHYRKGVAGAYDHAAYVEPRREMMQWLADEYDRLARVIPAAAATTRCSKQSAPSTTQ